MHRLYAPLENLTTISDNIIKMHLKGLVLDDVAYECNTLEFVIKIVINFGCHNRRGNI